MKSSQSRKSLPLKTANADGLQEQLRSIEDRLEQIRQSLARMQGQETFAAPEPTEYMPYSMSTTNPEYYQITQEPQFPAAKQNGWIDELLTLMDHPQVQDMIQRLSKNSTAKQKKPSKRSGLQ
jgi:hypothetical protein